MSWPRWHSHSGPVGGPGRSLDMLRCPVADYLASHDAADLRSGSWCPLDYALADIWGGTLQRSGTLVGGARCRDFRLPVPADPEQSRHGEAQRRPPMLSKQQVRRGVYHDVPELIAAIEHFIDGYNNRAQPFVWTKTPEQILTKATKRQDTSDALH